MRFHEAERFFADVPHSVVPKTRWQSMTPRPRGVHVRVYSAEYVFVEVTTREMRDAIEDAGCFVIEARANSAPNSPIHAQSPRFKGQAWV